LTCPARDALSGEQDVVLVDRPTELANDVICKFPDLRRHLVPMTRRLVLPVYSPVTPAQSSQILVLVAVGS
jgi:hypothetical protein